MGIHTDLLARHISTTAAPHINTRTIPCGTFGSKRHKT